MLSHFCCMNRPYTEDVLGASRGCMCVCLNMCIYLSITIYIFVKHILHLSNSVAMYLITLLCFCEECRCPFEGCCVHLVCYCFALALQEH